MTDTGAGQADGAGRGGRKVEHPAMDERAAVIDGDDDALAAMGHPELGAERQRAVGASHGVFVETLAGGGLAAGFVAVKGCHTGEAVSGARRRDDRCVGVANAGRIAGMVMAVMMMPGFS